MFTDRGSGRDATAASRPRRAGAIGSYINDWRFNTQAIIHDGKVLRGPMRCFFLIRYRGQLPVRDSTEQIQWHRSSEHRRREKCSADLLFRVKINSNDETV